VASRAKRSTGRDHTPGVVLDRVAACLREAATGAGIELADLQAVGLGAPGPIRPEDGSITLAPNLDWKDIPLRAELAARLPVPVAVGNDVRTAIQAEHAAGAGRGSRHMVAVWPGTGVGGGLILNGELYTGSGAMAGEVGHVTIKAGGPKCPCGGRGHLEALASRTAIVRAIAKQVKRGEHTALTRRVGKDVTRATSGDLAAAWRRGDKLVSHVLEEAASYLAIAIAGLATLLNPDLVVLGGGLIEGLEEPFIEMVRQGVSAQQLYASTRHVRIVKSELGDDAGITGAALIARRIQTPARKPLSAGPGPAAAQD
jgi:glucokinase